MQAARSGLPVHAPALAIHAVTTAPIWLAIVQLTGFMNLFNLIPVWQLDGSRGFHALDRWERWAVIGAVVVAFLLTRQRLLILIGAVAVWRALQREVGPGDRRTLAIFIGLVGALAWLARGVA